MSWYAELKNRLAHLRGRPDFDASLDEELNSHLEMRAEELMAQGLSSEKAAQAARREFGSTARLAEESRQAWRASWLEDLGRDLRFAARALSRDRGFALTAILSLALGIGVNTTVFSLATAFLFSEPSVRNPGEFVRVEIGGRGQVSGRELHFLRDAPVFTELTGFNENAQVNWRSGDSSERLFGARVSENFFEVTHVPLALGRPIQPGERDAVIVSFRFWQSSLQGDPAALGRMLVLDGVAHTIVGILPAGHRTLVGLGFAPDLYLPVRGETDRLTLYGRLPADRTRQQVLQKLESVCARLDEIHPEGDMKWARNISMVGVAGVERFLGNNRSKRTFAMFFAVLMILVGLLLGIACINVASLLLARAASRAREFAIRASIGAGRGRLIRQLLAESLLLSFAGAAAGLGLNLALTNFLNGIPLPLPVPIRLEMTPDWRLPAYGAAIAVATAVVVGLLPALTSTRVSAGATLKQNEHQVSNNAGLRKALVAGQLAVSVIVLVTAALFARNLWMAATMNPGFDLERTTWAQMRLVPESYAAATKTLALIEAALDRVKALPGVESVSLTNVVPLNDTNNDTGPVTTDLNGEPIRVRYYKYEVTPDYFKTMAIPLLSGRSFSEPDGPGSPRVAVINETFARKMFGAVPPVGHTIRFGATPVTVVGVAADSKYSTLGEDPNPAIYQPFLQHAWNRANLHFLIRTRVEPGSMTRAISRTLLALEPNAAVEVRPMNQAMGFALLPSRAGGGLLGVIGVLGLTLASIGLYGVLSYSVNRRLGEIGLRMALGAQRGDVVRLVMGEGAWILGAGVAAGMLISVFVTKPLAMFLVAGLAPSDPLTYIAVAGVMIAVGGLASLVPTLRALQADPAVALRCD